MAVNNPAQDPAPGQAWHSSSSSSAVVICPEDTLPTASNIVSSPILREWCCPASIGPPEMMTEGMFKRAAAMTIPGTILSQLVTKTRPSRAWALATSSMESAINSRLGRLKRIPGCPMARPSQTPMVPNSAGTPPEDQIPSLTFSATCLRCMCPGISSLKELATPIRGFSRVVLSQPIA